MATPIREAILDDDDNIIPAVANEIRDSLIKAFRGECPRILKSGKRKGEACKRRMDVLFPPKYMGGFFGAVRCRTHGWGELYDDPYAEHVFDVVNRVHRQHREAEN